MDLFVWAVILVIMGVLGWIRRRQEEKEALRRLDEPTTDIDDLPEETRRQLYGDTHRPIREAKPARRQSQSGAPPAIPTARPRQEQPTRRPTPERRESQAHSTRRAATPARRQTQSQPTRRTATPARRQSPSAQADRPAQQPVVGRMRSALEQMAENLQEQMNELEGRPTPPPRPPARRPSSKSPQQLAAEQAKRQEQIKQQRKKAEAARVQRQRQERRAAVARKPSERLIGDVNDLRRGIILADVLGTPKGLEF